MQNNYFLGFVLVVISGLVWSLGAPLVRFLEDAEHYRLPFLFYRGIILFLVVIAYVFLREGRNFLNSLKRIDIWSVFGGLVLSFTMFGWIYALTTTSVAVSLLMLALAPILAAFLGYLILGERLSRTKEVIQQGGFLGNNPLNLFKDQELLTHLNLPTDIKIYDDDLDWQTANFDQSLPDN